MFSHTPGRHEKQLHHQGSGCSRRVWRYQMGNQNPYIEEELTTQWPKEKVQKGKHRSTKHTYKTKDRVTRTPLKTGGELGCSGRESSSCSTSGTCRVNLGFDLLCLAIATQQYFSYIMATSFSGGRSWREPPTMGKQLVNFITCGCESECTL
jgi:hypothetical protein